MSGRFGGAMFFAIVGTFVLALLAGLLFLSSPRGQQPDLAPSAATTDRPWLDQVFLQALGGQLVSGAADREISMGRRACQALGEGSSAAEVTQVMHTRESLTDAQAARVMLAAVKAYCPEYAALVNP